MKLGSHGFFIVIFNIEDKDNVLQGGAYFMNFVGLFIKPSIPKFNSEKEDFSNLPVWIRLYSLP